MLLIKEKKALVFKLKNPQRVTTVIPTARQFEHAGDQLVVVHHGVEESIVLRNLGFKVPSPIRYRYAWPRKPSITPLQAQIATAEFLTLNNRAFVLSDMGTCKTLASLWAAEYLMTKGLVHKCLIVSTLSTLEDVWADEIMENFPDRNSAVLHGTRDKRLKLLEQDVDFYIINHDGIGIIEETLRQRPDIDLILIDEIAQGFRNSQTKRWKIMNRIVVARPRVWGMTGTPTPNAPTDAYGQVKLINPHKVPKYFGAFKDMVMRQVGPFKWLPRESANDTVHEAMQPSIRFERKDVVDLPDCMYVTRTAAFTEDQTRMYKQMLVELVAEYGDQQITAANDAVAASKLLQVAAGVVYGPDGSRIFVPVAPRIAVLREILEEATAKVLVFAPFRGVVEMLRDELEKDFKVGMIHGGVSAKDRNAIFHKFQKTNELDVIVAHPGTMSHGLTLTEANVVVWYAPIYSNDTYVQANARITRPGQKNKQFIMHIEGCDFERKVFKKLKDREKLQGVLLSMVKQQEI